MELFKPLPNLSIGINKPSIKTNDSIALEITRLISLHISSWSKIATANVSIEVALLANIPVVPVSKHVRGFLLFSPVFPGECHEWVFKQTTSFQLLFIHYYGFLLCYTVQVVTMLQIKAQQKQRDVTESSKITRRLKAEYTQTFWRTSLSPWSYNTLMMQKHKFSEILDLQHRLLWLVSL